MSILIQIREVFVIRVVFLYRGWVFLCRLYRLGSFGFWTEPRRNINAIATRYLFGGDVYRSLYAKSVMLLTKNTSGLLRATFSYLTVWVHLGSSGFVWVRLGLGANPDDTHTGRWVAGGANPDETRMRN